MESDKLDFAQDVKESNDRTLRIIRYYMNSLPNYINKNVKCIYWELGDRKEIEGELNKVLPSGVTVLSAEYINKEEKNIMSRVYAATYILDLVYPEDKISKLNKREIEDLKEDYKNKMDDYLSQDNILVLKKSKDRMERIDIRPQIIVYDFTLDRGLEITVSTGSRDNLKPDTIMAGYKEYINEDIKYNVKRTKILYD